MSRDLMPVPTGTVYDQGQQGSSVCYSKPESIEDGRVIVLGTGEYEPTGIIGGHGWQFADAPKPPTPKQRITAPSVPLSVRRKELARKMRAKR